MIGDNNEYCVYLLSQDFDKNWYNRTFENRKHFQDGGIIGFKIAICPESPFKR
jgi:hypothetical protein